MRTNAGKGTDGWAIWELRQLSDQRLEELADLLHKMDSTLIDELALGQPLAF